MVYKLGLLVEVSLVEPDWAIIPLPAPMPHWSIDHDFPSSIHLSVLYRETLITYKVEASELILDKGLQINMRGFI